MNDKTLVLMGIGIAVIGFAAIMVTIVLPIVTPVLDAFGGF